MARSDLLLSLVRAGASGDQVLFRRSVEALVAEERAKQHNVLADRLAEYLQQNGKSDGGFSPLADERAQALFLEMLPRRKFDDLILPPLARRTCEELVEEHQRADLLRSYGLEPRHRVLLVGPPGNGKTSLAEALAEALLVPMLIVRYDAIIASYLGETAVRLRRLFDYARTRRCVLFFDEFDTLGKERGDRHETGEIKRVVSSLLLQVDALPSYVVVVTATNHPELLDRAVWRRFQIRLPLPPPARPELIEWVGRFERRLGKPLGYTPLALAAKLLGLSYAEVEEFGADVQRRYVLSMPEARIRPIVSSRLEQLQHRVHPTISEVAAADEP